MTARILDTLAALLAFTVLYALVVLGIAAGAIHLCLAPLVGAGRFLCRLRRKS